MIALTAALVLGFGGQKAYAPTGPKIEVVVQGRGRFEITTDPKSSPKTVAGVIALVRRGFYDRQRFHRVEPWVVQWGAPASRTASLDSQEVGAGGSGKPFPFEGSRVAFQRGVVGIASMGARQGGDAQLFVLTRDALSLNGDYAVLGKVTRGMDVVDRIQRGDRITRVRALTPAKRRR